MATIRRYVTLFVAVVACLAAAPAAPAAPPPAAPPVGAPPAAAPLAPATQTPLLRPRPLLTTPWTAGVSTTLPWPEYPRPQLERAQWENLNGQWGYEPCTVPGFPPLGGSCTPPFDRTLPQTILVPFPISSALSGIGRQDTAGWYRRTFTVPVSWRGQDVELNFGAVGWAATVYVNRRLVATHQGDYDAFTADITAALHPGTNELVVGFQDPVGAEGEPVGKQALGLPSGITHTPATGIWQTVWLEPVAPRHLTDLELVPDLAHTRLLILPAVAGGGSGLTLSARALAGRRSIALASGPADRELALPLAHARLWWPWQPYLYGLRVTLRAGTHTLDAASSYFGMRSVSLGRVEGATRILLNGRFVYQTGALDQGYWPDGTLTAPSDAALRFDVATARSLGYDMLREHADVQPDRWYLWADRLGLLVWQDMPGPSLTLSHPLTAGERSEFRTEMSAIVRQRRSHPSVVTWVPFNEGWGQFDLDGVTIQLRRLDPNALIDAQSGAANCCDAQESPLSDIRDTHLYTGPYAVTPDARASVVGEYGGALAVPPPADRWPFTLYSIGSPIGALWPESYVIGLLRRQYAMLGQEMQGGGLSGSVFTEYDSPEQELGVVSYDRRAFTVTPSVLRSLNTALIDASLRLGGPSSPGPGTVPAGTAGFWPLTGAQAGAALDASGSGHPLALASSARFTTGPHDRPALVLPGSGAVAFSTAPVVPTGGSFTVSAWLRSDGYAQSATAVTELGASGSAFSLGVETDRGAQGQAQAGTSASGIVPPQVRTWWTFLAADGTGCAIVHCGIEANLRYDDGRDGVRTGSWHYVTGVVDRDTMTISIYVDGAPQDAEHLDPTPAANGPLALGGGSGVYGTGADGFAGAISTLRVYDRALSPAEIWQLYGASQDAEP